MAPSRGDGWTPPARQTQLLDGHSGAVHVVRYNHGAKYCLSGGADRTIRLWNPSTGKEIKRYEGHGREVLAIDIAHDNARFASCGGDKLVFVWDVASGTIVRRLQGHFGKINAVAFSQDAQVLATAGFDAKVMMWDMRAVMKDPIQTLKDATNSITSLALPPTAEVLSSSIDGHVRTYDLRLGKYVEDLVGSPCYAVIPSAAAPRESMLVSSEDAVRIFDRSNGSCLQTFKPAGGTSGAGRVKWGYGESTVVYGDAEGRVTCWNVLDGKVICEERAHKRQVTWLEIAPSGKEMITASTDGTIKVWGR